MCVAFQTVIICHFLARVSDSAPPSNSGGQVNDLWSHCEHGLATVLYSLCTCFGPGMSFIMVIKTVSNHFTVSGLIVGGFVSQSFGNGWCAYSWAVTSLPLIIRCHKILIKPHKHRFLDNVFLVGTHCHSCFHGYSKDGITPHNHLFTVSSHIASSPCKMTPS
jgi:hypothetical protein